jgi:hypothetical protein
MAMRAHVVLPEELVEEIDRVAGKRKRSHFLEAAVREKLAREALSVALREAAGSLDPADYPQWVTPQASSEWVRNSRREDNARLERKLEARDD